MPLPDSWWPWLSIAGLGVVHGLSPANGWLFVAHAARGEGTRTMSHALTSITLGHIVSVGLVAGLVMQGTRLAPDRMQAMAGAGLLAFSAWRWARPHRGVDASTACGSQAGLAAWSCLMGTTHGSGMMLVPALVPLCTTDGPARAITASGSLAWMLAAVVLHLLALLTTMQVLAICASRGLRARHRLPDAAWTTAYGVSGVLLLALR